MPSFPHPRASVTSRALGLLVLTLSLACGGCKDDRASQSTPDKPKAAATDAGAPEPGVIKGTALKADGSPIPSFGGAIYGYSLKSGQNVNANIDGTAGRYRTEVGPGQFGTRAWTDVEYNGRNYRIDLHPVDNKTVLTKQDTAPGLTKNFVWRLDGFRAGADPRGDDRHYSHFGGSVNLYSEGNGSQYWSDVRRDYQHKPESPVPADARVEVTLTPDGPLIDGSAGKPVVLTQRAADVKGYMDRITRGIPIGRYKASAKVTLADGTTKPARVVPYLSFKGKEAPEPTPAATLEFIQTNPPSENVNGVDEGNLHVTY